MTSYEDFRVLPLKYRPDSLAAHSLFFKAHSVRVEEPLKPTDRTLFCANVPPWVSKEALNKLFLKSGPLEAVYLEHSPSVGPPPSPPQDRVTFPPTHPDSDPYRLANGFRFAYVVFQKQSGLRHALNKLSLEQPVIVTQLDPNITMGYKRWAKEYNEKLSVNEEELKKNINAYMKEYDETVAEEKKANDALLEPDEDGWITVTKTSKKKPSKATKADSLSEKKDKKIRKKKKKLVLQNFYSHQIKEEKLSRIKELRNKFEEDKQKIAKMKADRKFRPF